MNVPFKGLSHPPKSNLRYFVTRLFFVVLLTVSCLVGFKLYTVVSFLITPGSNPGVDLEIVIPPGAPFYIVAEELKDAHAITDINKFEILAKWKGLTGKIKSGRFHIHTGWTPLQILDQLVNGKPIYKKITVPEGLPWWETAKLFEQAGLVDFKDFKTIIHDPEFLQHWGIPFHNAEGFLFPDTYMVVQPVKQDMESAKTIISMLIKNFWRKTSALWPDIHPNNNNTEGVKNPLILASIIEKETRLESERAIVSGVYANRLAKRIPLQACPTVIYGLGGAFDGRLLYRQVQDRSNVYNTYRYRGLPPGPISSPGIASIKAALNPTQHNYYYFVSRGDGSLVFTSSLAEHNKMIREYRALIKRERQIQNIGNKENVLEEEIQMIDVSNF